MGWRVGLRSAVDSGGTLGGSAPETLRCPLVHFHLEASVWLKSCSTWKTQSSERRISDPRFIQHRPVSMSVERQHSLLWSFPFEFTFSLLYLNFFSEIEPASTSVQLRSLKEHSQILKSGPFECSYMYMLYLLSTSQRVVSDLLVWYARSQTASERFKMKRSNIRDEETGCFWWLIVDAQSVTLGMSVPVLAYSVHQSRLNYLMDCH